MVGECERFLFNKRGTSDLVSREFTQRRWRRRRRRRRVRKRRLKSEFALPQTLSRLFHLV